MGGQAPAGTSTRAAVTPDRGMDRVDHAGRRVLAQTEPDRVAWALVSELAALTGADVTAVLGCVADCAHPDGCARPECRGRLEVRACLGNRDPAFAAAAFEARSGWLAGVSGLTPVGADRGVAPEGIRAMVAVPLTEDITPLGVAVIGRRDDRPWEPERVRQARRLCVYGEAALAAASRRNRAAEVAVTRERRRLAREMHDSLGQLLFGAGVAARAARESAATGRPDVLERLVSAEQLIGRSTAALRHALRSLDGPRGAGVALPVSIADAVEAFRHRTGVAASLVEMGSRTGLSLDTEQLLVRVVGEGLRNAERHGRAGEVMVSLSFEGTVVAVIVQDDGVGPGGDGGEPTGLGLARLQEECERAGGGLTLTGDPGEGATLRAWVAVER